MLAVVRWVRANLPARHVIIDSLMKLDIGPDDYGAQKALINRLHSLAIELGLHIHLVAHARKSDRETDRIDKFSIKGTSEIADQVDNIVLVSRNVAKEQKLERWEQERRDFANPTEEMEDVLGRTRLRLAHREAAPRRMGRDAAALGGSEVASVRRPVRRPLPSPSAEGPGARGHELKTDPCTTETLRRAAAGMPGHPPASPPKAPPERPGPPASPPKPPDRPPGPPAQPGKGPGKGDWPPKNPGQAALGRHS